MGNEQERTKGEQMIYCQKIVIRPEDMDERGRLRSNTYCMRPVGHKGPCTPELQPEDRQAERMKEESL
jgi:hypothetical protein